MSFLDKIKRIFHRQPVRESPSSVVIERMEYTKERGFELVAKHPNFVNLVAEIVQFLKNNNAPNYVEMGVYHEETGPLTLTVQRQEGETPAIQAARWKAMYNELIISYEAQLKQFVKAAKIQRDMLETGFWSHSIVCNYPNADGSTDDKGHCNCGVADMLKALRMYEEAHEKEKENQKS